MGSLRAREPELIAVLESLYEAALAPEGWDVALGAVVELHGGHAGKVGSIDFASGEGRTLALRGVDREIHDRWEAEHSHQDLWARAGLAGLSRDDSGRKTATGAELVDPDELRRTPLYFEVLRKSGIQDVVTTALTWSASTIGWMAVYRSPSEELFDREDRDLHEWVGRHARRAFALGALLRREQGRSRALLERLPCAAFVCEADGRVILHNARGEALLRRGAGLGSRGGRLQALHPADQDVLEGALALAARSAAGRSLAGGSTLRVRQARAAPPLSVLVDPLRGDGPAAELFAEPFFSRPAALVLASDPEARTVLPEEALAAAFGLTPAEARLLAALCAGESLFGYAERHRISRETARSHGKRLLAKTGARRQAELVRMAVASVVRLATAPPEDAGDR